MAIHLDRTRDAIYPVTIDGNITQRRSGNNIPHIELFTKQLSFCPQKDLVRKPYSINLFHHCFINVSIGSVRNIIYHAAIICLTHFQKYANHQQV